MALTFLPIAEDTPRGLDAMTARAHAIKRDRHVGQCAGVELSLDHFISPKLELSS